MLTTCKQNLGVGPWRRKCSRLKVLFIVMFTFVMVQPWNRGVRWIDLVFVRNFLL